MELDTPQERRWLCLCVLGSHALLLAVLLLQRPLIQPQPLEIELSLSAAVQDIISAQPLPSRITETSLRSLPIVQRVQPSATKDISNVVPEAVLAPESTLAKPISEPRSTSVIAQTNSVVASQLAVLHPNTDAAYLTNPKPGYPPLSRRLGEEGIVTLSVLVGINGEVEKTELAKSSGYPRLDEAASRAVQSWRFSSGKRAGASVAMWIRVPISFILEK